jgi:iron complex outermembrane recepter protein
MSGLGVNDLASERSPGYAVAHAEAGRNWLLPSGRLRTFARIENLLDRDYIGSVIVNEANGRYYETGLGRNFLVGAQFQWVP